MGTAATFPAAPGFPSLPSRSDLIPFKFHFNSILIRFNRHICDQTARRGCRGLALPDGRVLVLGGKAHTTGNSSWKIVRPKRSVWAAGVAGKSDSSEYFATVESYWVAERTFGGTAVSSATRLLLCSATRFLLRSSDFR